MKMIIKSKKWFVWSVIPGEPTNILSVIEFLILIIVLTFSIFLFSKWKTVPNKTYDVRVENLGSDNIFNCDVKITVPMTFHKEFVTNELEKNGSISFAFNNAGSFNIFKFLVDKDLDSLSQKIGSIYPKSKQRFYTRALQSRPQSLFFYRSYIDSTSNKVFSSWFGHDNNTLWQETYRIDVLPLNYRREKEWYDFLGVNAFPLSSPQWHWLEDISQAYVNLQMESLTIDTICLKMDFVGASEFSFMAPSPDVITMGCIEFYAPEKIKLIKEKGLRFHARFPEMENLQEIRILGVTAIIGGLLVSLIVFFIRSAFAVYYFVKKQKMQKHENTNTMHKDQIIKE